MKDLIESYIGWLKQKINYKEINGYFEVTTPFINHINDHIQFYLKRDDRDRIFMTDDGDTINNLVASYKLNPGIIVIDVEGAEMKVLKGSSAVLMRYKPIIILELVDNLLKNQESSSREVLGFLEELGYVVYDIAGNNKIKYPFNGNIIAKHISCI